MNISDILSKDMVVADLQADSKRQVIERIAAFIAQKKHLDANKIFEAIWEREQLGSTGYGAGVAFPHARIDDLNELIVAFVQLKTPIDYEAIDGKPVDILAVLVSPEKSGEDHLQSLALFSRILKNSETCKRIRQAKGAKEIYQNIKI